MTSVERAVSCFKKGFSCSQAVFSTYAEHSGLDPDTALYFRQIIRDIESAVHKDDCLSNNEAFLFMYPRLDRGPG